MNALPALQTADYFDPLHAVDYLDARYGESSPEAVIDGALKYFGRRDRKSVV